LHDLKQNNVDVKRQRYEGYNGKTLTIGTLRKILTIEALTIEKL